MPLDFPSNPTNGQVYDSYVYNSTVGAWQAREDSRTVAILSSTVPTSANPGDIWVNTNDGISFVYYDDGTSAQWMELLPSGVPLLNTKANIAGDTFTGNVTAPRFVSNITTGTAPFEVTSTTVVANLNADLLDGNHSTAFSPVAGSASITTVGTIGTGTWNATTIGVAKGGTGATDAATARTNLAITPANIGAAPSSHTHAASDVTSGQFAHARMPAGTVVGFNRIRTAARSTYGYTGDVILSDLNISITPKFSTSLLLVQWQVMYESDYNSVFRVYRDGGLVYTSGYQGYNENDGNTWSGIASLQYDTDVASTPSNQLIQYFVPAGSTATTTLQLAVRQSNNTGATFYLNRSVNSAGTGAYEIGVSTAVIWEIAQ